MPSFQRDVLVLLLGVILWTGCIAFAPLIFPVTPTIDADVIPPDHIPDAIYTHPPTMPPAQPHPSEIEMLSEFLKNDPTDTIMYTTDHICMDFAINLAQNLSDAGYESGCVAITAKRHSIPSGHMIVWVKLSNETVYIEPLWDWTYQPDDFRSGYNLSNYIIREITIQSAKWKRSEQMQWNDE